ncbi:MAG: hypothetical protein ACJ8M1_14095 [Chthoniobacterales bacterium]
MARGKSYAGQGRLGAVNGDESADGDRVDRGYQEGELVPRSHR